MKTQEKRSDFVEGLMYSRTKCMMFHGLNLFAVLLFVLNKLYFDVIFADTMALVIFYMIPTAIIILSFYLISLHDLSFIEKKRSQKTAIWRDHIEYYFSTFAKTIFLKRS